MVRPTSPVAPIIANFNPSMVVDSTRKFPHHINEFNERAITFLPRFVENPEQSEITLWFSGGNLSVNSNDHFMSLPDTFKKVEREC
jgi:hypothetical protein